jgi:DNA-binding response OmpR family regulator
MAIVEQLERSKPGKGSMIILIVDDEVAIIETLENKFRKEGFTTFTAETAEDGMRLFKRVRPNLVILDIMLPNRSGHDFCKAVRRENETPIIFVSARASEEDRIAGLEMGADDYVVKPFNMNELVARVRAILRSSSEAICESTLEPMKQPSTARRLRCPLKNLLCCFSLPRTPVRCSREKPCSTEFGARTLM